MKNSQTRIRAAAACALLCCTAPLARAAETRISLGSGNWNEIAWSPSGAPEPDDTVIIDHTVTNTAPVPPLAALTVNAGRTLVLTGWDLAVTAGVVTVNGTITHPPQSAMAVDPGSGLWIADHRVWIVCGSLEVTATGRIDAVGKGYSGATTTKADGKGPGAGKNQRSGAGHGGIGGYGYAAFGGGTYGSLDEPEDPGSGGGSSSVLGQRGGGAVKIEADGRVTVNGFISVNGVNGPAWGGACSAGSVLIHCGSFDGNGLIRAEGGHPGNDGSGGGGGGRIAVHYHAASQAGLTPTVQFLLGGRRGYSYAYPVGEMGTLWLSDSSFWPCETLAGGGRFTIPGFTNWSPASLTITNSGVGFPPGFELTPATSVTVTRAGELYLTNSALSCGGDLNVNGVGGTACLRLYDRATARCGGNLTLTNSSFAYAYSGVTTNAWPDHGVRFDVGDTFVAAKGTTVYLYSHPTNGGSALFTVSNFTVAAGARIDADGKGFERNPATSDSWGYGPGGGHGGGGGSYGGRGGGAPSLWTGLTPIYGLGPSPTLYGNPKAPVEAGSAGGTHSSSYRGGNGGGAVRVLAAGRVTVDGVVSANGNNGSSQGGSGSGGGIYLHCATFAGNGVLSAAGGISGGWQGGGGGGGRIAVVYDPEAQTAVPPLPAAEFILGGRQGQNTSYLPGAPGTLYLSDSSFWPRPVLGGGGLFQIPGFTGWSPSSLTITNSAVALPDGFGLSVTGDVSVAAAGELILNGGTTSCGGNLTVGGKYASLLLNDSALLDCGGDFTVTNTGLVYLCAGAEPSPEGASATPVGVGGALRIATNSLLFACSNPTNGGSFVFQVGSLAVAAGGRLGADAFGFRPGVVSEGKGFGPGGGTDGGGAGYGGVGGPALYGGLNAGGPAYGSETAPVDAGSGGGRHSANYYGGAGGGLVRVEAAKDVWVEGAISANGSTGYQQGGGGSGGGIHIRCRKYESTPLSLLSAVGGNTGTGSDSGGSGGGGRIAVWSMRRNVQGMITVTNGTGYRTGGVGTIFFGDIAAPGSVILLR